LRRSLEAVGLILELLTDALVKAVVRREAGFK
jgi:hypothetical protein